MIRQLNIIFKSFLLEPFDQEAWAAFDLACIYLYKQGSSITQKPCTDLSGLAFEKKSFNLKHQLEFIDIEKKKALDLQFFDYLNQLLDYKKVVSACLNKNLSDIKIYKMDYFVEKEGLIYFHLCNHPLINIKIMMIINRRCKAL